MSCSIGGDTRYDFLILLHLNNPRDRFGGETNERGYQNMKMDQRTGTVA